VKRSPDLPVRRAPVVIGLLGLAFSAAACTSSSAGDASASGAEPRSPSTTALTTPVAGGRTYDEHGVTFSYPKAWRAMRLADTSASTGTFEWTATVGIDPPNIVNVSRSTIGTSITSSNLAARTGSITLQVRNVFAQAGGSLTEGPTERDVGGLPALGYAGDARTPAGRPVHTRLVLVFDGTTEYAVVCQYDDRAADRILAGCDQVVSTFSVQG
jgi:hypothetical protein